MRLRVFVCALVLVGGVLATPGQPQERAPSSVRKRVEELEQAVSQENIKAAAEDEDDVEVLLGLAVLAHGNLAAEIRERAIEINPNSAARFYSVVPPVPGSDAGREEAFVRADPSNAMPYYRMAATLYRDGALQEALAVFRQATSYQRFESHRKNLVPALFKALDAMGLEGPRRLPALLNAHVRVYSAGAMSHRTWAMIDEAAKAMQPRDKEDLAEDLLSLAGQAIRSEEYSWSFQVKSAAFMAMIKAFRIKQELAAEDKSPREHAYKEAAAVLGKHRTAFRRNYISWRQPFDAIGRVFYGLPGIIADIEKILETEKDLDDFTRKLLEDLITQLEEGFERFLELAGRDPDGTLGPWLSDGYGDAAGTLESLFPSLARATEKLLEISKRAKETAENSSAALKTRERLMSLGLSLFMYASDHDGAFPEDLETLETTGYIVKKSGTKSAYSDKPFVYVGAALRYDDPPSTILAYDASPLPGDKRIALFADGHLSTLPAEKLEEMLEEQKKRLGE